MTFFWLVSVVLAFVAGYYVKKDGWQSVKAWLLGIVGVATGFLQNLGINLPF